MNHVECHIPGCTQCSAPSAGRVRPEVSFPPTSDPSSDHRTEVGHRGGSVELIAFDESIDPQFVEPEQQVTIGIDGAGRSVAMVTITADASGFVKALALAEESVNRSTFRLWEFRTALQCRRPGCTRVAHLEGIDDTLCRHHADQLRTIVVTVLLAVLVLLAIVAVALSRTGGA